MPADFEVEYQWQEGSLPPPHHFSFRVLLRADGGGLVTFVPGYAFQNPPTWTEPFSIAPADLANLHQFMRVAGVFERIWNTRASTAVGDSISSLRCVVDGKATAVSSHLAESDQVLFAELADAVRARVPTALWSDLQARLRSFQAVQ